MPITPSKVKVKINNQNETLTLISGEEINILKAAGLTDVSFDLLLPQVPYPCLLYTSTGVIAGTAVNKSATNMDYDGEYQIDTDYTQSELEAGILEGSFMFHLVDEKVVVLEDINTFISVTDEKSGDFSSNQTIRVLDQIANDIAVLFGKKYLGKVPNDASGRISLWNDIVKHHQELQNIRAIENFSSDNVTVAQGDTKKAVVVTDYVTPVNARAQLYICLLYTSRCV